MGTAQSNASPESVEAWLLSIAYDMEDVVGTAGSVIYCYNAVTKFGADLPRFDSSQPLGAYFRSLRDKLALLGEDARRRFAEVEEESEDVELGLAAARRLCARDRSGAATLRSAPRSLRLAHVVAAAAGDRVAIIADDGTLDNLCSLEASTERSAYVNPDEADVDALRVACHILRRAAPQLARRLHDVHLLSYVAMGIAQSLSSADDADALDWLLGECSDRLPDFVDARTALPLPPGRSVPRTSRDSPPPVLELATSSFV